MSELVRQKNRIVDNSLLRPAQPERTAAQPEQVLHPHPAGNQAAQQFSESCPRALPSPGLCPFGGACHACPARVQAKLTVSQPDDPYEQEADRVAEQVMSMPEPKVQRACPTCEEDEPLQTKPLAEQITPRIQRQDEAEEEEEEPVQAKVEDDPVQRQSEESEEGEEEEEEEPVLTKAEDSTIQRQEENSEGEEETVQAKPLAEQITPRIQRQDEGLEEEEEQPVQAKAEDVSVQRQSEESEEGEEEEEPVQTKSEEGDVQRQGERVQTKPLGDQITPLVQRQEGPEEEAEESIQAKGTLEKRPVATPRVLAGIEAHRNGGQPLSPSERAFYEPGFGADFSRVRLHSDPESGTLNDDLHSRAFTHGRHIWLGRGEDSSNRRLLAHELAHTIQQGAAPLMDGPSKKGAYTAGASPATQNTRPAGIQRSVQKTGVKSPAAVLKKIRTTLSKPINCPLFPKNLNFLRGLFTVALKLCTLGNAFDPGKGVDLPSNAFVYTCKGGWIDMGHFFLSAAGAKAKGFQYAWKKGQEIEKGQQRERDRYTRMTPAQRLKYYGRSFKGTPEQQARRGTAWSAYTIEDLPSDWFGAKFGANINSVKDIYAKMQAFFTAQGAVDASRNQNLLKKMMAETLGTTRGSEVLPRQHRSSNPVLLKTACPLCPGAPVCRIRNRRRGR
jgi:hypothetical protein